MSDNPFVKALSGDVIYGDSPTALKTPPNPKDAIGSHKVPFSVIPCPVLAEMALGMAEGGCKYGKWNWRAIEIEAEAYYNAAQRHLMAWWEGEDIDPDSGLNHVTKVLTTLTVLRDAMLQDKWHDNRPLRSRAGWMKDANERAAAICDKYPNPVAPFTEKNRNAHSAAHPPIPATSTNESAL